MNPEFYDFIIFLPRNARFHLSNSPRWYNESAIKTLLYKGLHTLPFSAQPFSKHMAGNQVGNHSTHNTCCMISALCYYPSVSARRHMNLPVRGQCFHGTPGSSKLSSLLPRKRHSWFQMDSNGIFYFRFFIFLDNSLTKAHLQYVCLFIYLPTYLSIISPSTH